MDTIILNAGRSTRLGDLTQDIPKCLIEIGGCSILEHQLDALITTGIPQIIIVTGYMGDRIDEFVQGYRFNRFTHGYPVPNIRTVHNPDYEATDNAYSLSLALGDTGERVIILDGDILFDPTLLTDLLRVHNSLVVDDHQIPGEEDCKVKVSQGHATGIGKDKTGYVYASMAHLGGRILRELRTEIKKNSEWYSGPLDRVLKRHPRSVRLVMTNGRYHHEIDTLEDLEEVESAWNTM
jgi:choline kinase